MDKNKSAEEKDLAYWKANAELQNDNIVLRNSVNTGSEMYGKLTADYAKLEKQNAELIFLLRTINNELDNYWNGKRSDFQIRTIEAVQKKCGKLIQSHESNKQP